MSKKNKPLKITKEQIRKFVHKIERQIRLELGTFIRGGAHKDKRKQKRKNTVKEWD